MKQFLTLFKIEAKLGLRCPDALIFGIGMPLGVLFLISLVAGNQSVTGMDYTFLQGAFASLLTVGICATAFMGIPLTLANYRDKKILKHFFVTPVKPSMILLVQVVLGACIAIFSAGLVALCSVLFFDYHMDGNLLLFLGAYLMVLLSMYSVGMIIASLCSSLKIANVVCTFVYFPMLFLSGATIPFEIFPKFLQNIAQVLPLTQGIKLLKGISLGMYSDQLLFSSIFLVAIALISCIISVRTFRWE